MFNLLLSLPFRLLISAQQQQYEDPGFAKICSLLTIRFVMQAFRILSNFPLYLFAGFRRHRNRSTWAISLASQRWPWRSALSQYFDGLTLIVCKWVFALRKITPQLYSQHKSEWCEKQFETLFTYIYFDKKYSA